MDQFLIVCWTVNYWIVFSLNWFIMPFFIEFLSAGDFKVKEKLLRSAKNILPNIIFYVVFFLVAIVILSFTESGRESLKKDGVLGCIIGLSLVLGLMIIVLLLGYGLVKVP